MFYALIALVVFIKICSNFGSLEKMTENSKGTPSELLLLKQHLAKMLKEHGQTILELKKSEEKFRTIANYTYNWEYWLDSDGEFLYNSPSCEGLTGFKAEEFISNPNLLVSIIHQDDKEAFLAHRQCSCYTSEAAGHIRFRIFTKNGELRWIGHSCQPVYNEEDQFLGRRASNRNISILKHAEEKISLSEERFRLALDASSDGVWDKNLRTNKEYLGDNWHHVLGYTEQNIKEGSLSWQKLLHPDDKPKFKTVIDNHLEGLTPRYEVELRILNKKGEWQWFLSRGKVVERSENGQALRIIGTNTDVTKSKENELELQNIKNSLEDKVAEATREMVETNVALKVLLKKMERDKVELERKISDNITKLVTPYLDKLTDTKLTVQQKVLLDMLTTNLKVVTDSFAPAASSLATLLTPTEFQVANLVKNGKTTKEIAEMMYLAPATISIHRKSIRKKLGIAQQNTNLQVFLSTSR